MGIINGILPQASAAVAHSSVSQATVKPETNASANAQSVQPAVVVSLSQESKSRAVSSGSNKFVDSTFGSEKYKANKKDSSKSGSSGNTPIRVVA